MTTAILVQAVLVLASLALFIGLVLVHAQRRLRVDGEPLVDQINALLPQTQCAQCGYPGCKPYAQAIAKGDAINKCPPGGAAGIKALAELLGRPEETLAGDHAAEPPRRVAFIREAECIGCTKCIQACPVDAIVGAANLMHTVIRDHCTGCDLCLPPCPVDCIDMLELTRAAPARILLQVLT